VTKILLISLHSHPFFFTDTATPEIYTLSLHDALPIFRRNYFPPFLPSYICWKWRFQDQSTSQIAPDIYSAHHIQLPAAPLPIFRSEEHTSELQSLAYLVCRLLLEKKNKHTNISSTSSQ